MDELRSITARTIVHYRNAYRTQMSVNAMKIEFLSNTNVDWIEDSILRIYDFDYDEVSELLKIFEGLSNGQLEEQLLNSLSYIEPVSGCQLLLKVGAYNVGVTKTQNDQHFECILSREGWRKAQELATPFCGSTRSGYQWLYNLSNKIELLLSPDGKW